MQQARRRHSNRPCHGDTERLKTNREIYLSFLLANPALKFFQKVYCSLQVLRSRSISLAIQLKAK